MKEPSNVTAANAMMADAAIEQLRTANAELRKELEWALSWMVAAERERQRDHYLRAVRLTSKPDPQAWRDKHK